MTQTGSNEIVQTTFDYRELNVELQSFIKVKAEDIHRRLKRTAEDIVAIGQALIEVKARLNHGQFGSWLQSEFGMTDRHARNFMNVASRFGNKTETISDLPATVLYLLAAPSTSDEIVEQVISGEIPASKGAIKEAIAGEKETEEQMEGPTLLQTYQETGQFDKAKSVLWTGIMLRKQFESMESMDELIEFAWMEFKLYPETAMEFMTYAGKYSNPNVFIPEQIRKKLEDLYDRYWKEKEKFIYLVRDLPKSVHAILLTGRKLEQGRIEHPDSFPLWLQTNFQIQESVADIVIGYAQKYNQTAIDDIPDGDMWEMAEFCAQHKLAKPVIGTAVFLDLPSQKKSVRTQWPPISK